MTAALARPSSAEPRLWVGRMRLATRLAMPPDIAARQTPLAADAFVAHAKTEVASLLADGDGSLWIIRRLRVSATADASGNGAEALARALREAVARALRGGAESVVRFESRAARLAAFVADLAEGEAFDRWYHARYRHLAPLPLAQALRLALAAEPDEALPALIVLLQAGRLARVIDRIGADGARAVLASVLPAATDTPGSIDPGRLAALAAAEPGFHRWGEGPQGRLALLVTAAQTLGAPPTEIAAAVPAALRRLALRQRPGLPGVQDRRSADPAGGGAMAPVSRMSARVAHAAAARGAPALSASLPTRFAGVFLLWRSVVELGLPALLRDGRMRLCLAATLAGPDRAAAFDDPALHWLADHVPEPGERTRPPPALAVAQLLVARAAPRVPALVRQDFAGVRVVQDAVTEDWLTAGSARNVARVVAALGLGRPGPAPDDTRPAAADLDHFGASDGGPAAAWAVLARAAHADLARRLPGLARSSASWVARNLVAGRGELIVAEDGVCVRLPRVPLDLVLRMTGLDGARVELGGGRGFRLMLPGPD